MSVNLNTRPSGFKIRAYFTLFRWPNGLIAGGSVLIGAAALPTLHPFQVLLGMSCFCLLAMAGNIQNDLLDIETDRWAHPERPLVQGTVSMRLAGWTSRSFYTIALVAAFLISPLHFVFACGVLVLLFVYNVWIKNIHLLGNAAVALLCAAPLYFFEWPGPPRYTWVPVAFAWLSTFIRELIKDAEDVEGDRMGGRHTYPVRYGIAATKKVVAASLALFLVVLPVPFFLKYHWTYIGIVCLIVLPLLETVRRAVYRPRPQWKQAQTTMKFLMLAGMTALLCGLLGR